MGDYQSGFWPPSSLANRSISSGVPSPSPAPSPAPTPLSSLAAVSGGVGGSGPMVKPSVYKSRLCVFHAAGRCSHGSACSFAHSAYELSDPKTVICPKIEQFGFCDDLVFSGSNQQSSVCPFAHDASELRQLPKVVKTALCRYFPQGRCKAGNACRHAHAIDDIDPAYLNTLYTPESASLTSLYLSMTGGSSTPGSGLSTPSLAPIHQANNGALPLPLASSLSPAPPLTTPSPMPSPFGSPRLGPAAAAASAVPASAAGTAAGMQTADGAVPELDLQSLQASLLALALELERMRTRGG